MGRLKRILTTETEAWEYIDENRVRIKYMYLGQNMTAKKLSETENIAEQSFRTFQKALSRYFKGQKGHGGARPGGGNKKGVKFCKGCGKSIKNCECDEEEGN